MAMRENVREPNSPQALERLRERGFFDDAEAMKLKQSYTFLRRCESALRRYENKAVSSLPSDACEQRKAAIRLGYDDFETFRLGYTDAREAIHALYERHIRNQSL
jgi:glutamine synthetase adenylyltransferase